MRIIRLIISVLLLSGFFAGPLQAQSFDSFYTRIKPALPTQSGDKIEVAEIFWYGCSHCYSFEPHIKTWLESKPDDVVFRQVPGVLNKQWIAHARAYYAAQKMNETAKLHTPLFNALHLERRNIFERKRLIDFADEVGIDEDEFAEHYDSNETEVKLKQAFLLARNARITGVPSLIVNGKYLISSSSAGSFEQMIATLDHLIKIERQH